MTSRRSDPPREDVVSRRLAQLSAELAAVRATSGSPEPPASVEPQPAPPLVPPLGAGGVRFDEPESEPYDEPSGHTRVPVPGRHAHRRAVPRPDEAPTLGAETAIAPARLGRFAGLLPETLRGRASVTTAHVAVLALVVAVGLVAAAWWLVRHDSRGELVAAPTAADAVPGLVTGAPADAAPSAAAADADAAGTSGDAQAGEVMVDVAGKVRRPGLVVLPAGARVADAIEAAGGARRGVDLTSVNQARLLVDGEQILVGVPVVPGVAASAAPGSPGVPATSTGPLVSLNSADLATLETLPGVGPVTAQAILDWRAEHGAFSSVDELLEVDGIGEATLSEIAPHVTL